MSTLAPMRVPGDYYERLHAIEEDHPWHRGMRTVSTLMLGERLRSSRRLLDAGCGTGGFLRYLMDAGHFETAHGTDVSQEALTLAARRVPEAGFELAPLSSLPFASRSFDLVVCNDVLQHVHEDEVDQSLGELRRVLRREGALLLRTNGARRDRREAEDWRAYGRDGLVEALERAGLRCERITYANLVGSLWGLARGRAPRAPDEGRDGIPEPPGDTSAAILRRLLEAEGRYLAGAGRSLPYGHTLLALATAP